MQTTHLFLDADNPAHPLALPPYTPYEVVRTGVTVTKRGPTVQDDEVYFVHYVRRL